MAELVPTAFNCIVLEPETLWHKAIVQTQHALQRGALQPILTDYEIIEDAGIPFLIRIVANLVRKDVAKQAEVKKVKLEGKPSNPFLPYDRNLFVTDITPTHLCLLNKFNVIEHHLLIVTREFEDQENWLTLQDFIALGACLAQMDGLGFYNGGQLAGSSQPHKHLQLIPFPPLPERMRLPIDDAIAAVEYNLDGIGRIAQFEFVHAIAALAPNWVQFPLDSAQNILETYYKLLNQVHYEINSPKQSGAYNLLITRNWMMLVPRSQESFQSIGVNSVGFAGALLVRNVEQLKLLKEIRPLNLLQKVAKLK